MDNKKLIKLVKEQITKSINDCMKDIEKNINENNVLLGDEWDKFDLRSLTSAQQNTARLLAKNNKELSSEDLRKSLGYKDISKVSGALTGFTQKAKWGKEDLVIKTRNEKHMSFWRLNPKYRSLVNLELNKIH